jgi:hypothetical protein
MTNAITANAHRQCVMSTFPPRSAVSAPCLRTRKKALNQVTTTRKACDWSAVTLSCSIPSLRKIADALPRNATALLDHWSRGDRHALDRLLPLVYAELRFVDPSKKVAHVLNVSASTAKREWRTAKAWVTRELEPAGRP